MAQLPDDVRAGGLPAPGGPRDLLAEAADGEASTHEPRWRDVDCATDYGLSDFEKYLGRPAIAELDAVTFEEFLRTWTWGPEKAAPKNAYAASPSELDAGLLYYSVDSRPVYLWNQPVVYTLRGRQAEWIARHTDKSSCPSTTGGVALRATARCA